ncbi:hypothetical protein C2E23DRAFT_839569 [Lenzites betulinus]|nr:hypothetical protein C2E23DRAFT_839569 [Lenzites betulinus]
MDVLDGSGPQRVYDAPMALNSDLSATAGLDPAYALARHRRLLYDLRTSIVGPLSVPAFLKNVVGRPYKGIVGPTRLSATNAFRSVPPTADTVEQIMEPLLVALNRRTTHRSRCPGFVFENTARRSTHPHRPGFAKPHISCLTRRNVEVVQRLDRHSRSELGYAELFIQVTANATHDYFTDPPPGLTAEHRAAFDFVTRWEDRDTRKKVEDAFALHAAFATEVFARQHRNGYHSIAMTGSRARLLHWDRAGCIVSESFDIREHPEHLCEFLWRFAQTSDAMRGHDTTVWPATLEQEERFRDVVREHVRSQLELEGEALDKAVSKHYCPGRTAVVGIYPQGQPISHNVVGQYIISRPVVSPLSLVSRGTRGYWAVESASSRLVFLKDTWHIVSEGTGTVEGTILGHLNDLGVRNIPTLYAHGDVPEYVSPEDSSDVIWQTTITGEVAQKCGTCCVAGKAPSVTDQQRYRLAVRTVGYGLSTLRGTEELLHGTYGAFVAMKDALDKASLIHRDISLANIILVKVPGQDIRQGYLIDWETSALVDDEGAALAAGRAGTWYFMSARMLDLDGAKEKQNFLDDMESLVHVIAYAALLYLPHLLLEKEELLEIIRRYFELVYDQSYNAAHGGDFKVANSYTQVMFKTAGFTSEALMEWLMSMAKLQRPRLGGSTEFGEQWTPEHVDAFWSDFLKTRSLERDNRIVHDITKTEYRDYSELSKTLSVAPIPPPTGKRRAVDRPSNDRIAKRRRSLRSQDAAGPRPTDIVSSRIVDGRRRSERIRTLQDCPRSNPTIASAPR